MATAQDRIGSASANSCANSSDDKYQERHQDKQMNVKDHELLTIKEKLVTLIKDYAQDILKSDHFRCEFQVRVQPLFERIRLLEDENRRLKITLEFFKNELKSTKCKSQEKKVVTKDQEVQVDELQFFEGEKEAQNKDKRLTKSCSLKRAWEPPVLGNKESVPQNKVFLTQNGHKPQQVFLLTKGLPNANMANGVTLTPNQVLVNPNAKQTVVQNNQTTRTANHVSKAPTVFLNSSSNKTYMQRPFTKLTPDIPFKQPLKTYEKQSPPTSSLSVSVANPKTAVHVQQSKVDSTTSVVSSSKSEDKKKVEEEDEIMEVEAPKPKTPEIVDILSDDEEEDVALKMEIKEILPECIKMHPQSAPTLPFAITPHILPLPKLGVRHGQSRELKKAVILRMESMVDTSKIAGALQYRIFSYYQSSHEKSEDRKWKQLTVIKVQSGKICECTLTQLMAGSRYHFVVCLVNGNNRSPFSNCASCIF